MRRIRGYLIGAVAGALLMLGGQALADIPDTQPSVVDPAHTLYGCYANNLTAYKEFRLLDKSQGNCPTGWREVTFAPVVPQTP
jgi:hypothetical protein